MKLRLLRGTPAALAGNQLIAVLHRTHDDRLKHAALGDRGGKLVDRLIIEYLPGLRRIRPDPGDFDRPDAAGSRRESDRGTGGASPISALSPLPSPVAFFMPPPPSVAAIAP